MAENSCIISYYCLDSTVPLAKNISELIKTDLIMLVSRRQKNAFLFKLGPDTKLGFVRKSVISNLLHKYATYLKSLNNIEIFVLAGRRLRHPLDTIMVFYLCLYLWYKNYSVIHIIGQYPRFAIIHFFFRKKIVHTFHEYTSHNLLEKDENQENSWLSRYPEKYIFHSQYVRSRFTASENQVAEVIPFSLYETFNFSDDKECFEIGSNAVTIIGIIRPYKGIQLFIDSIEILIKKGIILTPVIAGKGDLSLYSFTQKEKFTLINQELSDSQFCEIIKKSSVVVCPYLSASQSGVPMVAHLFNKPVVATNVGAFPEYISDQRLLSDMNPENIADIIERLLLDASFLNEAVAKQNETYSTINTWESNAKKTIGFYRS
jgi:glycosyltransferase involved in cell wall biosynthesis